MAKLKPCTINAKHNWSFIKNVTLHKATGTTSSFTSKGLYHCKCGEVKHGQPEHVKVEVGNLLNSLRAMFGGAE